MIDRQPSGAQSLSSSASTAASLQTTTSPLECVSKLPGDQLIDTPVEEALSVRSRNGNELRWFDDSCSERRSLSLKSASRDTIVSISSDSSEHTASAKPNAKLLKNESWSPITISKRRRCWRNQIIYSSVIGLRTAASPSNLSQLFRNIKNRMTISPSRLHAILDIAAVFCLIDCILLPILVLLVSIIGVGAKVGGTYRPAWSAGFVDPNDQFLAPRGITAATKWSRFGDVVQNIAGVVDLYADKATMYVIAPMVAMALVVRSWRIEKAAHMAGSLLGGLGLFLLIVGHTQWVSDSFLRGCSASAGSVAIILSNISFRRFQVCRTECVGCYCSGHLSIHALEEGSIVGPPDKLSTSLVS